MLVLLLSSLVVLVIGIFLEKRFNNIIINFIKEKDWLELSYLLDFDGDLQFIKRYSNLRVTSYLYFIYVFSGFNNLYLFIITICCYVVYKKDYWLKKRLLKKQLKAIRLEFPIWLRQVQVLLQVNTVAKALEYSLPRAPKLLVNDLKALIIRLKDKPHSVESYTGFLNNYQLPEVTRVMKMFYRYSIVGQKDAYQQLNRFIIYSTKALREERNNNYEDQISLYQWWGILPLFGVTVLFLVIMINYLLEMMMKGGIV